MQAIGYIDFYLQLRNISVSLSQWKDSFFLIEIRAKGFLIFIMEREEIFDMLEISKYAEKTIDCDGLKVEFEADIVTCLNNTSVEDQTEIESIYNTINEIQSRIDELNYDIDKLTNHADGIDYIIAVSSGVICGLVDVLFVGDLSLERANEWGDKKVSDIVLKISKNQGFEGDDIADAVRYLETKFPIAADKATNAFGGGKQHHLRDFSHHPTLIGLFFSLLTQFTKCVYGTDTSGSILIYRLKPEDLVLVGRNTEEKILFGVVHWFFHMVSDMAGSSGSIVKGKVGTGLPGPMVSLLKELSSLPLFKSLNEDGYKKFSVWISKLFNGTLLGEHDENGKISNPIKFDLRTEIGLLPQLGKQAVPIIINEGIVRGFYFVRHLYDELKSKNIKDLKELNRVNWEGVLPYNNRTIIRMLTISLGTFVTIDAADAAIESAIRSGGSVAVFAKNMIVKVNFVGIGRFTIGVFSDVKMGIQRNFKVDEVINLIDEQICCYNSVSAISLKSLLNMMADNSAENEISKKKIQYNQKTTSNNIMKSQNMYEENRRNLEELL